jgi:hypothetical protein
MTTDLTKERFVEQGKTSRLVGLVTFLTTVETSKLTLRQPLWPAREVLSVNILALYHDLK